MKKPASTKKRLMMKRIIRDEIANYRSKSNKSKSNSKNNSKSNSKSSKKSSKIRPGKSARFRSPKFHEPEHYMPGVYIPTKEELAKNSKNYLESYEMKKIGTSKAKPIEVRVKEKDHVKKFTMNGKQYTHWSLTYDGIQKMVSESPRRYKKGDVILMETEDERGELYLVDKNQKLKESNNILSILLDIKGESRSMVERLADEYPGDYEPIKEDIEEWLKMS